ENRRFVACRLQRFIDLIDRMVVVVAAFLFDVGQQSNFHGMSTVWPRSGPVSSEFFVRQSKQIVEALQISCFQADPKPARALRGGSVGERVGNDMPLGLPLEPVIPHSAGR